MLSGYVISTNSQNVLRFLLTHPDKSHYEREIARGAKISYGSANNILNRLYKENLIKRKIEGRMCYYSMDMSNPYIKEFKILNNLLLIESLIELLKPYARKIILYGSWAQGTDIENSDIDLFIITSDEDKVRSIVDKYSHTNKAANRKIQAIINTPADLLNTDEKETVFMEEVKQGKILWEREINEHNL